MYAVCWRIDWKSFIYDIRLLFSSELYLGSLSKKAQKSKKNS